jgi:hypothetical protein
MQMKRMYFYRLGMKHPLPQPQYEFAGMHLDSPTFFHSIIPVGIGIISTQINDQISKVRLIDTPDAFFYRMAFNQICPTDRTSFLYVLDLIGQISKLCVYRVETIEVPEDVDEFFEQKLNETKTAHFEANFNLYMEAYARN